MPSTVQEWRPSEGPFGMPLIDQVYDQTQEYPALPKYGTRIKGQSNTYGHGEFVFLKGVASTVAGSVVTYSSDDHSTALLVRDAIGPVAIAMAAIVADKCGWYMVLGKHPAGLSNDAADNASVYSSTTPGTVDDAASAGNRVHRAKYASADDTSTGTAEIEIEYPFVDDGLGGGST